MTQTADDISTSELRTALESAMAEQSQGDRRDVVALRRTPSPYHSSYAMEMLDAELSDGTKLAITFKNIGARLDEARLTKPSFLYNPRREIEIYRQILSSAALDTPALCGAAVDESIGRYWLFLEDVPGRHLWQFGEFELWQQVAAALATMHAKFATTSAERFASVPLVEYDETFLRTWIGRAIEFGRPVAQIAKKYDRVIERLMTMPRTLIHGECYASNILIDDATTPRRVWMIDWEMAGFAPGLIDLAALTAGKWIAAQKRALAISYYDAFYAPGTPGAPNEPPAVDRFLEDLDFCRLHLAVQWVGWSDHWTPPAAHAQDWLAEANALAEKLLS